MDDQYIIRTKSDKKYVESAFQEGVYFTTSSNQLIKKGLKFEVIDNKNENKDLKEVIEKEVIEKGVIEKEEWVLL